MKKASNTSDAIRNAAAADIFSHMATEEKSNALFNTLRGLPDGVLEQMSLSSGIPKEHVLIHRALMRGEDNPFTDGLSKVDGLLQAGDIVLMTGTSRKAQALANAQRFAYDKAKSSHVALLHADFICIDAMPGVGTTNRVISEVLSCVQDDWRVVRFKRLQVKDKETIARACVFYLAQPYSIRPSAQTMKKFSYCSELARKVFSHCSIGGTGIPDNLVIKPADFDRMADIHSEWTDVTEVVRPAIDFCREYEALVKVSSKLFIDGLKLNRARFDERAAAITQIRRDGRNGKMAKEKAAKAINEIKAIEKNLHNKFWDFDTPGSS
jgi:hypothetical protein